MVNYYQAWMDSAEGEADFTAATIDALITEICMAHIKPSSIYIDYPAAYAIGVVFNGVAPSAIVSLNDFNDDLREAWGTLIRECAATAEVETC